MRRAQAGRGAQTPSCDNSDSAHPASRLAPLRGRTGGPGPAGQPPGPAARCSGTASSSPGFAQGQGRSPGASGRGCVAPHRTPYMYPMASVLCVRGTDHTHPPVCQGQILTHQGGEGRICWDPMTNNLVPPGEERHTGHSMPAPPEVLLPVQPAWRGRSAGCGLGARVSQGPGREGPVFPRDWRPTCC